MIYYFSVSGLHNKYDFAFNFRESLNIFTGRNGIGKTTLLKFVWYMYSGNIKALLSEMSFRSAELRTTSFSLSLYNDNDFDERGRRNTKIVLNGNDFGRIERTVKRREYEVTPSFRESLGEVSALIQSADGCSIFFPTFRRIEGGFTVRSSTRPLYSSRSFIGDVGSALEELSNIMSSDKHKFVASVSTEDIKDLLTTEYANVSESTNAMYRRFSEFINETMGSCSGDDATGVEIARVFSEIKSRLSQVNEARNNLLKPFDVLSLLIAQIFNDKKISVSQNITFGKAKEVISSDILSAGEKQMLSFLSYNAFAKHATIFIDEPELSLHVDWQRILFDNLLKQGKSNQFIVTTHSPFIYTKYPECELQLNEDRGE